MAEPEILAIVPVHLGSCGSVTVGFSWLVIAGGLVLGVIQLAVGVAIGRALPVMMRGKAQPSQTPDLQRVRAFTNRLHRLVTSVTDDVTHHQIRIQQITKELVSVQQNHKRDRIEPVLKKLSRLTEINAQLQKRLNSTEEKLARQADQIGTCLVEARTDPLTGLLNRGAFDDAFHGQLAAQRPGRLPVCLVMVDIDGFKTLNDTHGHPAGDSLLRQLADVFAAELESLDMPGRIGGDEFAILLPRTDPEDARHTVTRIRQAVAESNFTFEEREIPFTISLGLAACEPGDDMTSLMKRADEALYASKQAGRNCAHYHNGKHCERIGPDAAPVQHEPLPAEPPQAQTPREPATDDPELEAISSELRHRLREVANVPLNE